MGKITDALADENFRKLRRACYQEIMMPNSGLPRTLLGELQATESLDDLLDALAMTPYWNYSDLRLLNAMINSCESLEAKNMLENFKAKFMPDK